MGINLSRAREVFLPKVPSSLQESNKELYDFLATLRLTLSQVSTGLFDNDTLITDAVNSGTSGTFTLSSGGSIVVTSGIVVTVTS